ncbi:MAG: PHP domain-containing protein, partial [Deltaproteobacteria bacterium]
MGRKEKEGLQVVAVDLHIHTCLSPCGSLDMTPGNIIQEACEKNLAIIAITDHNSAENTAAVIAAARQTALYVIPGIEVTTREEAHIVGLFDRVEGALSMQELVYQNLQPGENDENTFGIQVVANEFDEVEGINKRLLIGATALGVEEVVDGIHERHGLAVAAHIDRESFSLISQLGLIPGGLNLDALEISKRITLQQAQAQFGEDLGFPVITASDAHRLEEIGGTLTRFQMASPDMGELRLA